MTQLFTFSFFLNNVHWKHQWFGVFQKSLECLDYKIETSHDSFININNHFDCIFVHDFPLWSLQFRNVFETRIQRGERVYIFHHDNHVNTQHPYLDDLAQTKLSDFIDYLRNHSAGVIALNQFSYENSLNDISPDKRHLIHMPPVAREFNDTDGVGWLIFGRLRNKTEAAYATLVALTSIILNLPLTIGSLNKERRFQAFLHKFLLTTSHCHKVQTYLGKSNLKGDDEISAWDNCSVVIILRKKGHCNSAVLTKALAEGKLVVTTEIDAVKLNFDSSDIVVAKNMFALLRALLSVKRNLQNRRRHWRYTAANPENYDRTFTHFVKEIKNIIYQREYVKGLMD